MIGAEFQLKQSKMSASVDSNGKVDSTLEVSLCAVLRSDFWLSLYLSPQSLPCGVGRLRWTFDVHPAGCDSDGLQNVPAQNDTGGGGGGLSDGRARLMFRCL